MSYRQDDKIEGAIDGGASVNMTPSLHMSRVNQPCTDGDFWLVANNNDVKIEGYVCNIFVEVPRKQQFHLVEQSRVPTQVTV